MLTNARLYEVQQALAQDAKGESDPARAAAKVCKALEVLQVATRSASQMRFPRGLRRGLLRVALSPQYGNAIVAHALRLLEHSADVPRFVHSGLLGASSGQQSDVAEDGLVAASGSGAWRGVLDVSDGARCLLASRHAARANASACVRFWLGGEGTLDAIIGATEPSPSSHPAAIQACIPVLARSMRVAWRALDPALAGEGGEGLAGSGSVGGELPFASHRDASKCRDAVRKILPGFLKHLLKLCLGEDAVAAGAACEGLLVILATECNRSGLGVSDPLAASGFASPRGGGIRGGGGGGGEGGLASEGDSFLAVASLALAGDCAGAQNSGVTHGPWTSWRWHFTRAAGGAVAGALPLLVSAMEGLTDRGRMAALGLCACAAHVALLEDTFGHRGPRVDTPGNSRARRTTEGDVIRLATAGRQLVPGSKPIQGTRAQIKPSTTARSSVVPPTLPEPASGAGGDGGCGHGDGLSIQRPGADRTHLQAADTSQKTSFGGLLASTAIALNQLQFRLRDPSSSGDASASTATDDGDPSSSGDASASTATDDSMIAARMSRDPIRLVATAAAEAASNIADAALLQADSIFSGTSPGNNLGNNTGNKAWLSVPEEDTAPAESAMLGLESPSLVRMVVGASVNDPCVIPLLRDAVFAGLLLPLARGGRGSVAEQLAASCWVDALVTAHASLPAGSRVAAVGWDHHGGFSRNNMPRLLGPVSPPGSRASSLLGAVQVETADLLVAAAWAQLDRMLGTTAGSGLVGRFRLEGANAEQLMAMLVLRLGRCSPGDVLSQLPKLLAYSASISSHMARWKILSSAARLGLHALVLTSINAPTANQVASQGTNNDGYMPALPRLMKVLDTALASARGARLAINASAMVQRALLVELCKAQHACLGTSRAASRWVQEAGGLLSECTWSVRAVVEGSVLESGRGAAGAMRKHTGTHDASDDDFLWIGLESTQAAQAAADHEQTCILAHACVDLACALAASGATAGTLKVVSGGDAIRLSSAARRSADSAVGHVARTASDEVISYLGEAAARERTIALQAAASQAIVQQSALSTAMITALRTSGEGAAIGAARSLRSTTTSEAMGRINASSAAAPSSKPSSSSSSLKLGAARALVLKRGGNPSLLSHHMSHEVSLESKAMQQQAAAAAGKHLVYRSFTAGPLASGYSAGGPSNGHLLSSAGDTLEAQQLALVSNATFNKPLKPGQLLVQSLRAGAVIAPWDAGSLVAWRLGSGGTQVQLDGDEGKDESYKGAILRGELARATQAYSGVSVASRCAWLRLWSMGAELRTGNDESTGSDDETLPASVQKAMLIGSADEAASIVCGLLQSLCGAVGLGRGFVQANLRPSPFGRLARGLSTSGFSVAAEASSTYALHSNRRGSSMYRVGGQLGGRWRSQSERVGSSVPISQQVRHLAVQSAGLSGLLGTGAEESAIHAAGAVGRRAGISRSFGDSAWYGEHCSKPGSPTTTSSMEQLFGRRKQHRILGALGSVSAVARSVGLRKTPHDASDSMPSEVVKELGQGGQIALSMIAHIAVAWPLASAPFVSRVCGNILELPGVSRRLRVHLLQLIRLSAAAAIGDLQQRSTRHQVAPMAREKSDKDTEVPFDRLGLGAGLEIARAASASRGGADVIIPRSSQQRVRIGTDRDSQDPATDLAHWCGVQSLLSLAAHPRQPAQLTLVPTSMDIGQAAYTIATGVAGRTDVTVRGEYGEHAIGWSNRAEMARRGQLGPFDTISCISSVVPLVMYPEEVGTGILRHSVDVKPIQMSDLISCGTKAGALAGLQLALPRQLLPLAEDARESLPHDLIMASSPVLPIALSGASDPLLITGWSTVLGHSPRDQSVGGSLVRVIVAFEVTNCMRRVIGGLHLRALCGRGTRVVGSSPNALFESGSAETVPQGYNAGTFSSGFRFPGGDAFANLQLQSLPPTARNAVFGAMAAAKDDDSLGLASARVAGYTGSGAGPLAAGASGAGVLGTRVSGLEGRSDASARGASEAERGTAGSGSSFPGAGQSAGPGGAAAAWTASGSSSSTRALGVKKELPPNRSVWWAVVLELAGTGLSGHSCSLEVTATSVAEGDGGDDEDEDEDGGLSEGSSMAPSSAMHSPSRSGRGSKRGNSVSLGAIAAGLATENGDKGTKDPVELALRKAPAGQGPAASELAGIRGGGAGTTGGEQFADLGWLRDDPDGGYCTDTSDSDDDDVGDEGGQAVDDAVPEGWRSRNTDAAWGAPSTGGAFESEVGIAGAVARGCVGGGAMWTGGGLSKRGSALPRAQVAPRSLADAEEGVSIASSPFAQQSSSGGRGGGLVRTGSGQGHMGRRASTALIHTMAGGGGGSGRMSHSRSGSLMPLSLDKSRVRSGTSGSIAGSRRLSTILSPRARGHTRSRGSGSRAGSSVAGGSMAGPSSPRRHSRAVSSVGIDSIMEESTGVQSGGSVGKASSADSASVASEAIVYAGAGDDPNGEAQSRIAVRRLKVLSSPLEIDWMRVCEPIRLDEPNEPTCGTMASIHNTWSRILPYQSVGEFLVADTSRRTTSGSNSEIKSGGADLVNTIRAHCSQYWSTSTLQASVVAPISGECRGDMKQHRGSASVALRTPTGELLLVRIDRTGTAVNEEGNSGIEALLQGTGILTAASSKATDDHLRSSAQALRTSAMAAATMVTATSSAAPGNADEDEDADELDLFAAAAGHGNGSQDAIESDDGLDLVAGLLGSTSLATPEPATGTEGTGAAYQPVYRTAFRYILSVYSSSGSVARHARSRLSEILQSLCGQQVEDSVLLTAGFVSTRIIADSAPMEADLSRSTRAAAYLGAAPMCELLHVADVAGLPNRVGSMVQDRASFEAATSTLLAMQVARAAMLALGPVCKIVESILKAQLGMPTPAQPAVSLDSASVTESEDGDFFGHTANPQSAAETSSDSRSGARLEPSLPFDRDERSVQDSAAAVLRLKDLLSNSQEIGKNDMASIATAAAMRSIVSGARGSYLRMAAAHGLLTKKQHASWDAALEGASSTLRSKILADHVKHCMENEECGSLQHEIKSTATEDALDLVARVLGPLPEKVKGPAADTGVSGTSSVSTGPVGKADGNGDPAFDPFGGESCQKAVEEPQKPASANGSTPRPDSATNEAEAQGAIVPQLSRIKGESAHDSDNSNADQQRQASPKPAAAHHDVNFDDIFGGGEDEFATQIPSTAAAGSAKSKTPPPPVDAPAPADSDDSDDFKPFADIEPSKLTNDADAAVDSDNAGVLGLPPLSTGIAASRRRGGAALRRRKPAYDTGTMVIKDTPSSPTNHAKNDAGAQTNAVAAVGQGSDAVATPTMEQEPAGSKQLEQELRPRPTHNPFDAFGSSDSEDEQSSSEQGLPPLASVASLPSLPSLHPSSSGLPALPVGSVSVLGHPISAKEPDLSADNPFAEVVLPTSSEGQMRYSNSSASATANSAIGESSAGSEDLQTELPSFGLFDEVPSLGSQPAAQGRQSFATTGVAGLAGSAASGAPRRDRRRATVGGVGDSKSFLSMPGLGGVASIGMSGGGGRSSRRSRQGRRSDAAANIDALFGSSKRGGGSNQGAPSQARSTIGQPPRGHVASDSGSAKQPGGDDAEEIDEDLLGLF